MTNLLRFDLRLIEGCKQLVGVDEAGRGALAGPVVAAAVLLNTSYYRSERCRSHAGTVNDSKLLTHGRRKELFGYILNLRLEGHILAETGIASVEEIEKVNILGATRLAMRRALECLEKASGRALRLPKMDPIGPILTSSRGGEPGDVRIVVDGRPLRPFAYEHKAIVRGDGKSLAIALSSIMAKVTRDEIMCALGREFPHYGFAAHKGYGTAMHRNRLLWLGPSIAHRPKFLRKIFEPDCGTFQLNFNLQEN